MNDNSLTGSFYLKSYVYNACNNLHTIKINTLYLMNDKVFSEWWPRILACFFKLDSVSKVQVFTSVFFVYALTSLQIKEVVNTFFKGKN